MSRADALKAAIEANERWSPAMPQPLSELIPDGDLLPPAAYEAAADLGIEREECDEIATVIFTHLGSHPGAELTPREVRDHPLGRDLGFTFFWGWLANEQERQHPTWADEGKRIALWEKLPPELREEIGDRMHALKVERDKLHEGMRKLAIDLDERARQKGDEADAGGIPNRIESARAAQGAYETAASLIRERTS